MEGRVFYSLPFFVLKKPGEMIYFCSGSKDLPQPKAIINLAIN